MSKPKDIMSRGQGNELLNRLEAAGLNSDLAQPVIRSSGNEFAKRVVAFIRGGGYEVTISQRRARDIMGKNFLGIEEVGRHLGVKFLEEELDKLDRIPFPETVLEECEDTHILFAGFPLTIIDVRLKAPRGLSWPFGSWYNNRAFAKNEKVALRWYLIRKDIVPGSTLKIYEHQLAMLSEDEEVPRVCEVIYMATLYLLATGTHLFGNIYARCQDLTDGGYVHVGSCTKDKDRLGIHRWEDNSYLSVGVAASRKV